MTDGLKGGYGKSSPPSKKIQTGQIYQNLLLVGEIRSVVGNISKALTIFLFDC